MEILSFDNDKFRYDKFILAVKQGNTLFININVLLEENQYKFDFR
jgi:hypothetical protein